MPLLISIGYFGGRHELMYHSQAKRFLPALSNTNHSSRGWKILEKKYFHCFLSICFLFTVSSRQCSRFSCEASQFSYRGFHKDRFSVFLSVVLFSLLMSRMWLYEHTSWQAELMVSNTTFKHIFKCAGLLVFFYPHSYCGTVVGRFSTADRQVRPRRLWLPSWFMNESADA